MSLIRDDHQLPVARPGAARRAPRRAATWPRVPYNAMLRQLSTPETSGRISGFGWAAGYFGSVVLLLVVYVGFISGDGRHPGLLGIPVADGQNVRAAMLLTAAWFAAVRAAGAHRGTAARRPRADAAGRSSRCARRLPQAVVGRGRASGAATATSSTTCSPARCSGTDWPACSRSARCSASASTASRRPTCCCSAWRPAWWPRSGRCSAGMLDDRVGSKPVIVRLAGGDDRRRARP